MSDTGTDSDCTMCVTNNGDIADVDKDFDLSDISVSSEGTVDLTACLTITMAMYMLMISQTLSNTQHTKQTDTLTEQHTTYNDTTSHSLLLRSKRL